MYDDFSFLVADVNHREHMDIDFLVVEMVMLEVFVLVFVSVSLVDSKLTYRAKLEFNSNFGHFAADYIGNGAFYGGLCRSTIPGYVS